MQSIYGALIIHSPHQACRCHCSLLTDEDAEAQTRGASRPKSTIRIRALICMHSDANLLQDRLPLLGDTAQPGPSILPPASWAQKNDPGSNTLVHTEPGLPGGGSGRPRPCPGERDLMQPAPPRPRGEQTRLEGASPRPVLQVVRTSRPHGRPDGRAKGHVQPPPRGTVLQQAPTSPSPDLPVTIGSVRRGL